MKYDLSNTAGFPLYFDSQTLEIESGGGLTFKPLFRRIGDLKEVLLWPESVEPEREAYRMYMPVSFPPAAQPAFERLDLTYSLVLLPTLTIGGEYVKTHGHYHPLIQGTPHPYPEIYTQLYGELFLMMQKRRNEEDETLEDCAIVKMKPGFVIALPPGYSHILINPTASPALMAGLYGRRFKPDYGPIKRKRGHAYYILAKDNGYLIERNPNYPQAPELRWLGDLFGTPFEPPDPGQPVWEAFNSHPECYEFLTQAESVMERFGKV